MIVKLIIILVIFQVMMIFLSMMIMVGVTFLCLIFQHSNEEVRLNPYLLHLSFRKTNTTAPFIFPRATPTCKNLAHNVSSQEKLGYGLIFSIQTLDVSHFYRIYFEWILSLELILILLFRLSYRK